MSRRGYITLYRLGVHPSEDDCYDEHGAVRRWEWFSAFDSALARRQKLIKADPELAGHRVGVDFEIERIKVRGKPTKKLVLSILNKKMPVLERELVVPEYVPRRKRRSDGAED